MLRECPVCIADHPTGRYTQTYAGLTHQSRECAGVASIMGVTAMNAGHPGRQALLRAAKRRLETVGAPLVRPLRRPHARGGAALCHPCGGLGRLEGGP